LVATVTVEDFRARYPEFNQTTSDARVELVLEEASLEVNDDWIEIYQRPAILALTAHLLASEGALYRNDPGSVGGGVTGGQSVTGPVMRKSIGPLSIMYARPKSEVSGSSSSFASKDGSDSYLGSTPYGARYLELMTRSFPAVAII
jgi:hypothetical protein